MSSVDLITPDAAGSCIWAAGQAVSQVVEWTRLSALLFPPTTASLVSGSHLNPRWATCAQIRRRPMDDRRVDFSGTLHLARRLPRAGSMRMYSIRVRRCGPGQPVRRGGKSITDRTLTSFQKSNETRCSARFRLTRPALARGMKGATRSPRQSN